jgi:hypothetical protein
LQAQGRDRVADLVCDTSRYTTDGGEALRRRDPYGQRLRLAACPGETPAGFVQGVNDAIEFAFSGLVQGGDSGWVGAGERGRQGAIGDMLEQVARLDGLVAELLAMTQRRTGSYLILRASLLPWMGATSGPGPVVRSVKASPAPSGIGRQRPAKQNQSSPVW